MSYMDRCYLKYGTTGSVTALGCLALQKNQAAYFAAQPKLFKPKVVTHLFILRSSA